MRKMYFLSLRYYAIIRFIERKSIVCFDELVLYLGLYRRRVEDLVEDLIEMGLVKLFDADQIVKRANGNSCISPTLAKQEQLYIEKKQKYLNYDCPPLGKYDKSFFVPNNDGQHPIYKQSPSPFLWRTRITIAKIYQKTKQKLSASKEWKETAAKQKRLINEVGKTKEINLQKKWAKKVLRSKDINSIVHAIKKAGYIEDPEMRVNKTLLMESLDDSIGFFVEHKRWGIDLNLGVPKKKACKWLTFYTPYGKAYCYYK